MAHWDDPTVFYDSGVRYDSDAGTGTQAQKQGTKGKRMKRQRWYPSRIGDQIPWLENFHPKLVAYAAG
jgi:hypothetical protein